MQEITFKDIYNTLVPKLKILLIVLLVAAVVGGCIGVAKTYASISYGTTIEFYVNPKMNEDGNTNQSQFGVYGAYGWHVMDNMTKLLASESFAEEMLLGEDGLPIEAVLKQEADRAAIDAKIAEAREAIAEVASAKESDNGISGDALAELEAVAQAKIAEVMDIWRKTETYFNNVDMITKSVTYSFYNDKDMQISNAESLAKSFIYVKIATFDSEETAKFIYERINEVLPEFVETNMAVPSGYIGTNCQRITRLDEIKQTNSGALLIEALKYAILIGVLAFVCAAIFIVAFERYKKWCAMNKSAQGGDLNTSDVSLGDSEVAPTGKENIKEENAPEWK